MAWPWLGRRGRIVVAVLVTVVCLSRVYVGAHLPLDVVGGAALGLAVGGAVRLLHGTAGLMLVDSRRGLLVSGGPAGRRRRRHAALPPAGDPPGGAGRGRRGVAVRRCACENDPTTAVAVALSWLGSGLVNWPLRAAALVLLAWRRHWLRLAAFALAVLTSELLIGTVKAAVDRPRPPGQPDRDVARRPSRRGTPSPPR